MATSARPDIKVRSFALRAELDAALAERLSRAAADASSAIMLAGGSTPGPAFSVVGSRGVRAAAGLHILYSDERHVPSSSDASNYHLSQPLLSGLELPAAQVLRVRTELALDAATADYAARLQGLRDANIPIRLGLLGLGADGHTASLFSERDLAAARGKLAIAVARPDGRNAVSVTPDLLAEIHEIVFVVAGADKTAALARLRAHDPTLIAWRAVARCAQVHIWADAQALPA